jgi:serine/threonine-protein kinase
VVPDLAREIDAIVLRGLEKDPRKRFASAREMALAIEQCMPLAPTHEVGEWVEKTAHAMLVERAQKIAEIESRSSETKLAAASMALVENPAARAFDLAGDAGATKPDYGRVDDVPITAKDEATDGNPGTQLTQVSSQERPPGQRRGLRLASAAALVAFAFGTGGWLIAKNRTQQAPTSNGPEPAPAMDVSPPPLVVPPALPSSDPVDEAVSKPAAPEAAASSAANHAATKRAPPPPPKRSPCNPPYVVDENHIRHIKPQCL